MKKFKKNSTYPKMVMLNSEGDILTAFKETENKFLMVDDNRNVIATLSTDEAYDFTRGFVTLVNTRGERMNYQEYPGGMKPDLKSLDEFLGVNTEGVSY